MTRSLSHWRAAARFQTQEVADLVAAAGPERLPERFIPEKWSVLEHIGHLSLTNGPYLDAIEAAAANAAHRTSENEFRGSWFGRWFVGTMEPPPKLRLPTTRALTPKADLRADRVVADFMATQKRTEELLDSVDGLDLDRLSIRSPVLALIRLRLSDAFALMEAHNRRHLWLMREVLDSAS